MPVLWSPDHIHPNLSISTDRKRIWHSGAAVTANGFASFGSATDKWYCEIKVGSVLDSLTRVGFGRASSTTDSGLGKDDNANDVSWRPSGLQFNDGPETALGLGTTWTTGDVLQLAFDPVAGKGWFGINGTWVQSGAPATATNPTFSGAITGVEWMPGIMIYTQGAEATAYFEIVGSSGDWTYTAPSGFVELELSFAAGLDVDYGLMIQNSKELEAMYEGYAVLGSVLRARWEGFAVLGAELDCRYRDAANLVRALVAVWRSMPMRAAGLVAAYHLRADLIDGLDADYALADAPRAAGLVAIYDLMLREPLVAACVANWALLSNSADIRDYGGLYVIVGGSLLLSWTELTITEGEDEVVITAELTLASAVEFSQLMRLQAATVFDGTTVYHLVVDELRPNVSRGTAELSEDYGVTLRSQAAIMAPPYSRRYDFDNDTAILASDLAQDIVDLDGLTVEWNAIDWTIPAHGFIREAVTAMDALRDLVDNIALIQSQPGGIITIDQVTAWEDIEAADPALDLSLTHGWHTYAMEDDASERFNAVTVGDGDAEDNVSLEIVDRDLRTKIARGYRVPWAAITLLSSHSEVVVSAMGTMTEQVEQEVEFVDGRASVTRPVYSAVTATWGTMNLGAVTATEGGELRAAVAGNSLATVTYTTKFVQWMVTHPVAEPCQLYVPA